MIEWRLLVAKHNVVVFCPGTPTFAASETDRHVKIRFVVVVVNEVDRHVKAVTLLLP